jgi:hypothetical protein
MSTKALRSRTPLAANHVPPATPGERRRRPGRGQTRARQQKKELRVADLGWTVNEAREARARLVGFEEDWDAPGMQEYDNL